MDVTTTTPAPNATPTAQPAYEIGPAHPRALGATIGVGALVFGIVESAEHGWTNPMVLVSLVVAVVILVAPAHQLGMALGLAALVAAAANATQLVSQVSLALTWGTGLLTLCLVVVLAVIVPAHHRSTDA